ncbi:ankyrin [Zopfia rhizophila CBS 207.26]|uniref:Ankyrin n=1 Tax=Zopfia rhizophila CBS 207.26 TaxID=1314779 RepID=A0A6A6D9D3_9PEZI|nr:ankyrin [Zopfia rhizophila CBS 207.26]
MLGMRAIAWVVCLLRPLTVPEFEHTLSAEIGDHTLNEGGLIDINILLGACAGWCTLMPSHQWKILYCEYISHISHIRGIQETGTKCHQYLIYAAELSPAHAALVGNGIRFDILGMLVSARYPALSKNWLQFALREALGKHYLMIPVRFAAGAVAMHGAPNVLKVLLDDGLYVNVWLYSSWAPFKPALLSKDPTASICSCEQLLDTNLDIITMSDHIGYRQGSKNASWPLLAKAISYGDSALVDRLLQGGWDPSLSWTFYTTRLAEDCWEAFFMMPSVAVKRPPAASARPLNSEVLNAILFSLSISTSSNHGNTINSGRFNCLQLLINAGANVNLTLPGLKEPLSLAIELEREDMINILLKAGALANPAGENFYVPLRLASSAQNARIIQKPLSCGVVVKAEKNEHPDPFMAALEIGCDDILKILLPQYLSAQVFRRVLTSTMISAIEHDKAWVLQELLREKCKSLAAINLDDANNLLLTASRKQMSEIVQFLLELGVKCSSPNGIRLLLISSIKGYLQVISKVHCQRRFNAGKKLLYNNSLRAVQ